jgi:hypothetical protein|tara:strand:- start:2807 stop:5170 length:2364 start_codon:yes stop_codon:yes gene_type:complete
MNLRVQDPLFLLSAQTGLQVGELAADAASGNPDVNQPQKALKTGEPIPIIFCRRRNSNGGVLVQPKITEGFFSNDIEEESRNDGSTTVTTVHPRLFIKLLFVLGEGNIPQLQIRDVFYGANRRGTFNQAFNARAGTWTPGNTIDAYIDVVATKNAQGEYDTSGISSLSSGQTLRAGGTLFYKLTTTGDVISFDYNENDLPVFCGTSGTYSGLTTLSFEHTISDFTNSKVEKTVSAFVRKGLQVTRLVDGVTGESDNFVDLAKHLFQTNNRLADDLIDNTSLTIAAKFTDTSGFLFNGKIDKSQNLLDWLQATSVNYLLRVSNSGGKFGLVPRLPYNTDHSIKTTQITPEFTFTEEHVLDDGFEVEYISLENREPVCFQVAWRQQPESDFGLVRTVQVRYTGEATNGPFINIDMSAYCTSENHAVKVGTFRLAQRKYITHHLRLTVRERSYNATLVVGDLVRVRLRRETSEGGVEFHDTIYEINRIEKAFQGSIVYDLTHFPVDSQGRSIIAREVAAAVGAGNTINTGRSAFDGDENSSSDDTAIGTDSGGGGSNQPPEADTELDLDIPQNTDLDDPFDIDVPFPDPPNNPADPLEAEVPVPPIEGFTDTPTAGDTLTFTPSCPGAFTEWYKVNINTGVRTKIGSGVGATLAVTEALQQEGVRVIGVGRCPDPSSPDGYGQPFESDPVDLFDEIVDCPGGGDSGGQGTFTKVINVGSAFPASFNFRYTAFTIQDRFVISGAATLDTGFVSGTNVNVTVQKTSADPYITVTVFAPTGGTAWNYDVGCAS